MKEHNRPKILFAGGGTGGHLYPGIALAQYWERNQPDWQCLFVGTERHTEVEILRREGYPHHPLPIISTKYALQKPLRFLFSWQRAQQLARKLIRQTQPQLVIGLGGYASYPLVRQAARAKIPIVLMEQNAYPGRATRYLSRFSIAICISYAEASEHLNKTKNTIHITGNPLRQEFIQIANINTQQHAEKTLLVTGGSQGSDAINRCMLRFAHRYTSRLEQWTIRHQTGNKSDAGQILKTYQDCHVIADVKPFFPTPQELYQGVRLAVSRAGATTLAELAALNIPGVIVPIANSVDQHQLLNAQAHQRTIHSAIAQENQTHFQEYFDAALLQMIAEIDNQKRHPPTALLHSQHQHLQQTLSTITQICQEYVIG